MKKLFAAALASMLLLGGCGDKKEAEKPADPDAWFKDLGYAEGTSEAELLAFPGADGFGKYTKGGRGGKVIEVTNLNDSGEGSLRAAVESPGPRIVLFKVCGNIELQSPLHITEPNITIAGQSAPGEGICLANYGIVVETQEVIVRYLRVRPGDQAEEEGDALWVKDSDQVVIDHVTASWGTDETLSVSGSDHVSVQWCLISESLNNSIHSKGTHGMGSLIRGSGGQKVSFHHNLYFCHRSRSPMNGNYSSFEEDPEGFYVEFINNVVYNWNGNAAGKNHDENSITRYNYINNYYKSGGLSSAAFMFSEECPYAQMYAAGNAMNGEIPEDQYSLFEFSPEHPIDLTTYVQPARFEFSMMSAIDETEALYENVLSHAGDYLCRDVIDTAVLDAVKSGGGRLIDTPSESVGYDELMGDVYPELVGYTSYVDMDSDGLSDEWEKNSGLDPESAEDGAKVNKTGYSNMDVFLEYLVQNPTKTYGKQH